MGSEICTAEEPLRATSSLLGSCCGAHLLAMVLNSRICSPGVGS